MRAAPSAHPSTAIREVRTRGALIRTAPTEAVRRPRAVAWIFALLATLMALLAANQLLGWGGDGRAATFFYDHVCNDAVFLGSAALAIWFALRTRAERAAWWFMGSALVLYCSGDIVWSLAYADSDASVTWADPLYLSFAPLMFIGLALLVRARISHFELSRWVDGVAAALLVSAPGVVLVLAPAWQESDGTLLTKLVSVAYPMSDIVLLGAAVGAMALTGWRPGRAWFLLAAGFISFAVADSMYAIQNLSDSYQLGTYDFLWPLTGLFIAAAAWLPSVRHVHVQAWGWRAIALPVVCQMAPIVLMFLKTGEPISERLLMVAVLAIVLVQLVVTRPRAPHMSESTSDAGQFPDASPAGQPIDPPDTRAA